MLVKNPYKFTSKYLLTNQIDALDVIQSTQFEQRIETFLLRLSNFLLKLQKFDDLQKIEATETLTENDQLSKALARLGRRRTSPVV